MTYVIEVHSRRTDTDPQIEIFTVEVNDGKGVWQETFGSLEALNAYLKGMKTVLFMENYVALSLEWTILPGWIEPSGIRWTVNKDAISKIEYLHSDGHVVSV